MLLGCYPGGMARTAKVSIALDKDTLVAAKRAATAEGTSLSALVMRLLSAHLGQQAKFEAMGRFLTEFAPNFRATERELQAIRDEWTAPLKPIPKRRRRAA